MDELIDKFIEQHKLADKIEIIANCKLPYHNDHVNYSFNCYNINELNSLIKWIIENYENDKDEKLEKLSLNPIYKETKVWEKNNES